MAITIPIPIPNHAPDTAVALAMGDKHWFDQLSPPGIASHLQPFVEAS
jgi:hypothetical protein